MINHATSTTAHSYRSCPWVQSGHGHCPSCRAKRAEVMRRHRAKQRHAAQSAMISGFLAEAA